MSVLSRDYTNDLYYIADQIRSIRESKGWSQEEFADRADISRSTLYRIETGNAFPIDVLLRILDIGEISAERILPLRACGKEVLPADFGKLNAKNKDVVMNTVATLIDSLLLTQ